MLEILMFQRRLLGNDEVKRYRLLIYQEAADMSGILPAQELHQPEFPH